MQGWTFYNETDLTSKWGELFFLENFKRSIKLACSDQISNSVLWTNNKTRPLQKTNLFAYINIILGNQRQTSYNYESSFI